MNTMNLSDVLQRIDQVLAVPELKNAITGIGVYTLKDGLPIYERQADLSLVPASNLKLLTAVTALVILEPEFRYKTTLLYTGELDKNGVIQGDLYLRGSGDPSLTSDRLQSMLRALQTYGIHKITGRVIGDGTAFDDRWLGTAWQWDEEMYYYSAQLSALNCDENLIAFQILPGKTVGEPAQIIVGGKEARRLAFEETTYVRVRNTTQTSARESKISLKLSRARAQNEYGIGGTIPLGADPVTVHLTIEDPARFTATRFAELAKQYGIDLPEMAKCVGTGATPANAKMLLETESAPLSEVLKPLLKDSNNLYGEALLKTFGKGTADGGVQRIGETLKSWGLDTAGWHQFDGSGLSRMNTVPPHLITEVLRYIDGKLPPEISEVFFNALPIAGVDGTLAGRMKGTVAQGAVHAKTGSLDNDSSMSGYLKTLAGERLVFSILMNHFALGNMGVARRAQNAIAVALMDLPIQRA